MLKSGVYICFFSLFVLYGCTDSFTPGELRIIEDGKGVMRLWKVSQREDSLFLRRKVKPLTAGDLKSLTFQKLKERMLLTVNDPADQGVGIAAPQVGIGRALIAVRRFDKSGEPFEFYINPKIEFYSEEKILGVEGCLSIPAVRDSVWRSNEIEISYIPGQVEEKKSLAYIHTGIRYKKDMRRVREKVEGFTAIIFQHEIDHLKGILFTDRREKY